MIPPDAPHVPTRLRQLERRNTWMWGQAALLLIALGIAVGAIYLAQVSEEVPGFFPAPQTRGVMAGGLLGVIGLFCLYILLKQHEMQRLRSQLIDAQVREESLRARLFGLSGLLQGVAEVAMYLDLEALLATLAEHVRAILQADQVSIMLLNPETNELECRAVSGMDAEFVRGARVRLGDGVSGWVAKQNEALVLDRAAMAARFPGHEKTGRNITTALCLPLAVRDQVIGVLNLNRLGSASPFGREDVEPLMVFGAHAAIAIRRIIERQQDERVRQAQKMEALGRLAGGVAHDLNNLLTVMLSYSSSVAAGLGPDHALRGAADKVCSAAERCASLTGQLLALGRTQILQPELLDLNPLVAEVSELLGRVIREDIDLVIRLSPEPAYVRADRGQIEQVILNLVLNARDAMNEGGILTLETEIARVDPASTRSGSPVAPGTYAVLRARDTGRGMDPEALEHAFEPFFTTKTGQHTGLDLATVHAIVTHSGGVVRVDSEVGKGSVFEVYLPAVPRPGGVAPSPPRPAQESPAGGNILLVEDDEVVREVAREFLETGGYKVYSASQGVGALQLSARCAEPIDLLLTDVIMPGMSGPEIAERIRRQRPQMRVLFMSGYTADLLDQHGVSRPGTAFLPKPFTCAKLLAAVRETLTAPLSVPEADASLDVAA